MIVLGGNCEPLSAFRQLNVETFPGPFDWLGVPTVKFPELIKTNWWDDVFSIENIVTYGTSDEKNIGVRDLKYQITSLHHFKRVGLQNWRTVVAEQLPKFRNNLKNRWLALQEELKKKSTVVYREFIPVWGDPAWESGLQAAYEALLEFAPNSELTIVTENNHRFDKAAVVIQKKIDVEYFRVDVSSWHPAWRYAAQSLEPGRVYNAYF
jgi:hypothetical protein